MSYTKTCKNCSNDFVTNNYNKTTCCRGARNVKRAQKRAMNDLTFIGVDGEGLGRPNGEHDYVMLSVGDKTLTKPDGSQLTYTDIFPFLWEQYLENPSAAFIGFYLGYDFTQWTKKLPRLEAYNLWHKDGIKRRKPKTSKNPDPFPVYCDGWEFDVLTKRRFRLRKHVCVSTKNDITKCRTCLQVIDPSEIVAQEGESSFIIPDSIDINDLVTDNMTDFWTKFKKVRKPYGWMYICDTGPFWQTSLMKALNPKNWPHPVCTTEEYATLKKGKDERAKIVPYNDLSDYEEMRRYNILENDVLARMTRELNRGFVECGLHIRAREWYGPGRAAQIWLDQLCKTMLDGQTISGVDIRMSVPEYARKAGRYSYIGGWFEHFVHGHIYVEEIEEDDLNSAYPYIISELPCLHHGTWSEGTGAPTEVKGDYYILHAEVKGSDKYIGTMPHRTATGKIIRPSHTSGWYWKHEVDAAVRAKLIDTVEVIEYVQYHPCNCPSPMRSIKELYRKRLEVGKNTPQGIALKLVYNSAYGKMAQSAGVPKYSNSIYASLITAGCRTMILDAIATHPEKSKAVVMIATDGIYFTSPHPNLKFNSEKMGAWDKSTKHNLTQFMPGIYWDDKLRDALATELMTGKKGDSLPSKTRGINVRDLANKLAELDRQFFLLIDTIEENPKSTEWPTLEIPVTFDMVSAVQAITRNNWSTAGKITTDGTRSIDSNPRTKRLPTAYLDPDVGIRTFPYKQGEVIESTPYDKRFGEEQGEWETMNDVDMPDGEFTRLFSWAMKG